MQSIPATMAWEILKQCRWGILAATLWAIAFPTIVLTALQHEGALNPTDESILIMNIIMLLIGMMVCIAALQPAFARMPRLYAYPARTSTMVVWRLIPAMVIIALQTTLSTIVVNFLFGLHWPLAGPVFFAPVVLAVVVALYWLTEKSQGWLVVLITIAGATLGIWLQARYGAPFSNPTHNWIRVTPLEAFTMVAALAAAYYVAVKATARNRRGEPPLSIGLVDWLNSVLEHPPRNALLMTSLQAQVHTEWQRKGWMMPFAVAILIASGFAFWTFASRNAEELIIGMVLGGNALWMIAFIGGLILGNTGPNDASYAMGQFLATRPISDADMARALLRTTAKSVLLSWSIWAATLLTAWACLWLGGRITRIRLPDDLHWLTIPATLIGPWIVTATFMSLTATGRPRFLIYMGILLPICVVVIPTILSRFLFSAAAALPVTRMVAVVIASGLLLIAAWAFAAARRKNFIQSPTVWAAATIWASATSLIAYLLPFEGSPGVIPCLLVAAATALAVAPVATVPLALSWNRHR